VPCAAIAAMQIRVEINLIFIWILVGGVFSVQVYFDEETIFAAVPLLARLVPTLSGPINIGRTGVSDQ
jgi:hypothetical protein